MRRRKGARRDYWMGAAPAQRANASRPASQDAVHALVGLEMEGADPAIDRFQALKTAAIDRLEAAQTAADWAKTDDIIFDASMLTARLLGYVEGLAIDRPALAQDLLLQSRPVIEAIARLSEHAGRALRLER